MPITTPSEIITFAMRAGGILGVGQSALAEDYSDVFDALNGMLAMWSRKRWLVYHELDLAVTVTGAQSYTLGTGGAFNTPRQDRLEAAFFRQMVNSIPNLVDFPLEILESREDYNRIALKSLATTLPRYVFFDSGYPLGSVYPWPIPQAGLGELHVCVKATLGAFTSFTQSLNVPDEYREAIWTNLAIRIAAIYPGAFLAPETKELAKSALATLRGANTQIPRLMVPRFLTNKPRYNIFSDSTY